MKISIIFDLYINVKQTFSHREFGLNGNREKMNKGTIF